MSLAKPVSSRRRFIQERLLPDMTQLMSSDAPKVISSLILQIRPEKLDSVNSILNNIPNTEIHGTDGKSKVVLVIETQNDSELAEFMSVAAEIPGVINVCMVFHHTDKSTDTSPVG